MRHTNVCRVHCNKVMLLSLAHSLSLVLSLPLSTAFPLVWDTCISSLYLWWTLHMYLTVVNKMKLFYTYVTADASMRDRRKHPRCAGSRLAIYIHEIWNFSFMAPTDAHEIWLETFWNVDSENIFRFENCSTASLKMAAWKKRQNLSFRLYSPLSWSQQNL